MRVPDAFATSVHVSAVTAQHNSAWVSFAHTAQTSQLWANRFGSVAATPCVGHGAVSRAVLYRDQKRDSKVSRSRCCPPFLLWCTGDTRLNLMRHEASWKLKIKKSCSSSRHSSKRKWKRFWCKLGCGLARSTSARTGWIAGGWPW